MKKQWMLLLLSAAALAAALFAFAACEKGVQPGHEHTWGEGKVTKAATCMAEGEMTYTCTECSQTQTVPLAKAAHTYTTWVVERAASCTQDGKMTCTCDICGSVQEMKITAFGHTPDAPVTENERAATCTAGGSSDTVVYCKTCGEELSRETKESPALGHNIVQHAGKAPTCRDVGWEAYEECTRCGYSTYRELARKEHDWIDDESRKDINATCTTDGVYYLVCAGCGMSSTERIPSTGHTWKNGGALLENPATCMTDGYYYRKCEVCGYLEVVEWIPFKGHHYVDGICTECGMREN